LGKETLGETGFPGFFLLRQRRNFGRIETLEEQEWTKIWQIRWLRFGLERQKIGDG